MELRIPPLVQVILAAAAMWLIALLVPLTSYSSDGAWWLAVAFGIAGVAVALSGVFAFSAVSTTVDPRSPEKTSSLVTKGVYRLSRNPMYFGFLLLLIGWSLFLTNILTVAMLPVFMVYMNKFQIEPEERQMMDKFGDEYLVYKSRVRRCV